MRLQMFLIYSVILFTVAVEGSDQDVLIEFNMFFQSDFSQRDFLFKCKQDDNYALYRNEHKTYYILEGQRILIKFQYPEINFINCDVNKNGIIEYQNTEKSKLIYVPINKLHANMSGVLTCTIFARSNTSVSNRVDYEGIYYATTKCFAEIHVRPLRNPMRITINDKNLPTFRSKEEGTIDFYNEYLYTEGEEVNVFCSKSKDLRFQVYLEYDPYAVTVENKFKDFRNNQGVDTESGSEFNVQLRRNNNGSHFKCSLDMNDYATKVVTDIVFILNNTTDAATASTKIPIATDIEDHTSRSTKHYEQSRTVSISSTSTSTIAPIVSDQNTRPENVPDDNNVIWICVAIAFITVIVIVVVVTVIYKMKKNAMTQMLNEYMYKNLTSRSDSIPPFPEQWNTYSSERNLTSLYATPVPKNQRYKQQERNIKIQPGTSNVEPTYCEVINYSNSQVKPQGDYNNVFDKSQYMNYNNTEYVEPAYCEAVLKNNKGKDVKF